MTETTPGALGSLDLSSQEIGPRCLVTGGAGYVGRHLIARLLERGCEVRTLDVRAHQADPRVDTRVGDVRLLRDVREACRGIDTVFHTAALINLLARYRPEVRRRVFGVNVLGTEQVIRACEQEGVGRLVYTSTINVVMGEAIRRGDETRRYVRKGDLLDLYAETKAEAEQRVLAADHPGGLRTAALRLGGIWGPGEGCLMMTGFLEQLSAGRLVALIGNGRAEIDNTYIENGVDAHLLAAARLAAAPEVVGGQAYFITDDEPMNGVEWFRPFAEALGHAWPTRRVPGRLMYRVAHAMEWLHFLFGSLSGPLRVPDPSLTRRSIMNLIRDSSFRIDKARRELGYAPRVQVADGLAGILPELKQLHDRMRDEASR